MRLAIAMIAAVATLSLVAADEHHHHHHESADYYDVQDHGEFPPAVQTGTWNVAGTKSLIKEFEGLRLTALVSFSFNLGCGSLQSSTMLKRLNARENPNTVAREEMPKWVKAGGKVVPGLVRRRDAEVKFFTS
ncbi:hypothetical protein FGO68_gene1926 [Halteria grandinella]|uniref:Lysozyme n=1 Tax=Halteria grandinella TaxID=5974 RepID=A0A8J8SZJ3_HALGN|nr:hypothetical protein FGO68_gene1926 [Halteria grandinella]